MFAINFNINRGVKVIMEINILNKAGQFVGIRPHLNVRWPQFTLNKDVWWSHYCVSLKVMSQRNGHWLRELRLPLNSGIKMSQSAIYQSSASNMWTKNYRTFLPFKWRLLLCALNHLRTNTKIGLENTTKTGCFICIRRFLWTIQSNINQCVISNWFFTSFVSLFFKVSQKNYLPKTI